MNCKIKILRYERQKWQRGKRWSFLPIEILVHFCNDLVVCSSLLCSFYISLFVSLLVILSEVRRSMVCAVQVGICCLVRLLLSTSSQCRTRKWKRASTFRFRHQSLQISNYFFHILLQGVFDDYILELNVFDTIF